MCARKGNYVGWHGKAKTFQCQTCRHQTTLTSGPICHSSKLPLMKWVQAMYLLTQSKNNIAALELMRLVGVCYRTAWRLEHNNILEVMCERECLRKLEGRVAVDDGYLGGARPGGKGGRGSPNKVPFIVAVGNTEDGWALHAIFSKVKTFGREDVKKSAIARLTSPGILASDGLDCFKAVKAAGATHIPSVVGKRQQEQRHALF